MSKRIALLSAVAFGALALTATVVAPVSAQEKTVMVGGAAMYPTKTIVQNAVNSKDHTTLVAAVKAAGLVDTLERPRPVHGLRADQCGLRQVAGRHGRYPGEAREQGHADQDPHLSRRSRQA